MINKRFNILLLLCFFVVSFLGIEKTCYAQGSSAEREEITRLVKLYKIRRNSLITLKSSGDMAAYNDAQRNFHNLFVDEAVIFNELPFALGETKTDSYVSASNYIARLGDLAVEKFKNRNIKFDTSSRISDLKIDKNTWTAKASEVFYVGVERYFAAMLFFTFVRDSDGLKIKSIAYVSHENYKYPPVVNRKPDETKVDKNPEQPKTPAPTREPLKYVSRGGVHVGWNESVKLGTYGGNLTVEWFRIAFDYGAVARVQLNENTIVSNLYAEVFPEVDNGEVGITHYAASRDQKEYMLSLGYALPELWDNAFLWPSVNVGFGLARYNYYRVIDEPSKIMNSAFVFRTSIVLDILFGEFYMFSAEVGYGWSKFNPAKGAFFTLGAGVYLD